MIRYSFGSFFQKKIVMPNRVFLYLNHRISDNFKKVLIFSNFFGDLCPIYGTHN